MKEVLHNYFTYFKLMFATLILVGSTNVLAIDIGVPAAEKCGLDTENKIIGGDYTICPNDGAIRSLYELFPTLTLDVIKSLNLDYKEEIIEQLIEKTPVTVEQRRLEVASYFVEKMMLGLTAILIIWSLFQIIWTRSAGKGDADDDDNVGAVNAKKTITFMVFAGLMYTPVNDHSLYQYVAVIAAIIAIGLSNLLISSVISFYQYAALGENYGDQFDSGDDESIKEVRREYDGRPDSLALTESDLRTAVCILQLVNRDALRRNQHYFASNPIIDSFDWSYNEDNLFTPLEVQTEFQKTTISMGSGVQRTSLLGSIKDYLTSRDPQLCGVETIIGDTEFSQYALSLDDDFKNTNDVLNDLIVQKMGTSSVENSEDLKVVAGLNQRLHSAAMNIVRNPAESEDYRLETLGKAISIASDIRKLNCLTGDVTYNITEAKESLKNLSNGSYNFNLTCASNLEFDRIKNIPRVGESQLMYDMEIIEEDGAIEREKQTLINNINKGVDELVNMHNDSLSPVIESYLKGRYVKNSNNLLDVLTTARQNGLPTFSASFTNMTLFSDQMLKSSAPYQVLLPQVDIRLLDNRYLPEMEEDTTSVGEIKTLGYEFKTPRSEIYNISADLGVDIQRMESATKYDEELISSANGSVIDKFLGGIAATVQKMTFTTGLAYSDEMFKGSLLKEKAIREGWTKNKLTSTYISDCNSNRMTLFNTEMINQCQTLNNHPVSIMQNLGVNLFNTGSLIIQDMLIAKGLFSKKINKKQTSGSVGSNSAWESMKADAQNLASDVQRIGSYILSLQTFIFGIGILMVIVGALLGYLVPLIPAILAGAVYIYWLLAVVIGVVGGSILLLFAFTPRMVHQEGHAADNAWFKLVVQIILKPTLLVAALAIVYLVSDVGVKMSLFLIGMFWQNFDMSTMAPLTYAITVTCSVIVSIYLVWKIFLAITTKITTFATELLKKAELGAHTDFDSTSHSWAEVVAAKFGLDVIQETSQKGAYKLKKITDPKTKKAQKSRADADDVEIEQIEEDASKKQ